MTASELLPAEFFDREFMCDLVYGDHPDTVTLIHNEQIGTSRWSEQRRCVFEWEGDLFGVDYSQGLTEQQDERAFEFTDPKPFCVEAREKTIVEYIKIKGSE